MCNCIEVVHQVDANITRALIPLSAVTFGVVGAVVVTFRIINDLLKKAQDIKFSGCSFFFLLFGFMSTLLLLLLSFVHYLFSLSSIAKYAHYFTIYSLTTLNLNLLSSSFCLWICCCCCASICVGIINNDFFMNSVIHIICENK